VCQNPKPTGLYTGQQGLHTGVYHVRLAAACCTMRAKAAPALLLPACMLCLVLGVYISPMLLKLPGSHTSAPAALAVARGVELGRGATRPAYLAVGEPPGFMRVRRKPPALPCWRAAERRHPTGRERMVWPTLQTHQDPILLLPWFCFRGVAFQTLGWVHCS
jgi:hypothetical protein